MKRILSLLALLLCVMFAQAASPLYMVIDLSSGASSTNYPISYLNDVPSGGWTDEHKTTKLVLRCLDAGSFIMGDDQTAEAHRVTLTKPFYMGLFEMTQKQWELVMESNPCASTSYGKGDNYPVHYVSYDMIRGSSAGAGWPVSFAVDSTSFLGKLQSKTGLNFDLPTEAQWEYACRAGTTTTYYWGTSMNGNYAWYSSNSSSKMHPVGGKTPNGWGLYDMSGNVREWCLDWNDTLAYGTDPKGSSSGLRRVDRGGSWYINGSGCTSFHRRDGYPSDTNGDGGFRLSYTISKTSVTIDPADGTVIIPPQKVAMTAFPTDAVIHYTTDGSDPTEDSPVFRKFNATGKMTIKAISFAEGYPEQEIAVSRLALGTCEAPVIEPIDGTVFTAPTQTVTMATATTDAVIHYTLDGSIPTENSTVYSEPLVLDRSAVVSAISISPTCFDSTVATSEITRKILPPGMASDQTFSGDSFAVVLTNATEGAAIHYTVDGSVPTSESPLYEDSIVIGDTTSIRAIATLDGCQDSEVFTALVVSETPRDGTGNTVTSVSCRQRYPWNGLVDIDYTIAGNSNADGLAVGIAAFAVYNGVTQALETLSGDICGSAGTHRMTWNAAADSPGVDVADATIVVQLGVPSGTTWYVDAGSGNDSADGLSWSTARATLQSAIDSAANGDTVLAMSGTYAPITALNRDITIRGVYGAESTIIDGGNVARCATLGAANASQTNNATMKTRLEGFTLRNGSALQGGGVLGGYLANCIITNNVATEAHGASGAGAAYSVLNRCMIADNLGYDDGGGALGCLLRNCLILRNTALNKGGDNGGGGITVSTAINCTIIDNRCVKDTSQASERQGGAASCESELANCVAFGNRYTDGTLGDHGRIVSVAYTCSESSASGTGNIVADPLFVDAEHGDYRLQAESPCIDAGSNAAVKDSTDLDGHARIQGAAVDMGAYEYGAVPAAPTPVSVDVVLSEARSAAFRLLSDAGRSTTETHSAESVVYSPFWSGADGDDLHAVVTVNGEPLLDETGEGVASWTPGRVGPYMLCLQTFDGDTPVGDVLTADFDAIGPVVTITPADGSVFTPPQKVNIESSLADATIYYTTDGSEPTTESPVFRKFNVVDMTTIKAIAVVEGYPISQTAVATLAPGKVATPVIEPADGTTFFFSDQPVEISCATEGAVIRYTCDGTEPTAASPVYTVPLAVSESTVIRAKAFLANFFDSDEVQASLTRSTYALPAPVITLPATFQGASVQATIVCAEGGATLHYTLDGSIPTAASPVYTGPIILHGSATVRAMATKDDFTESPVVSVSTEKTWGIADALSPSAIRFSTEQECPWTRDTSVSRDGVESMRSGAIGDDDFTTLMGTVSGSGTLVFWWKASCEDDPDFDDWDCGIFQVEDDASTELRIDGLTDWVREEVQLGEGDHVLTWTYRKDESYGENADCIWLDQVSWTPADASGECTVTTEVPVPYTWLKRYGLFEQYGDYEAAAHALSGKVDGNGTPLTNWEEYLCGTDPTNALDRLLATIEMDGDTPIVLPDPNLGAARKYTVIGKAELEDGKWHVPAEAGDRFFRIRVSLPDRGADGSEIRVVLDSRGGSVSTGEIWLAPDTALGSLPVPERTGYTFLGWYTAPNGGEVCTAETVPTGNTTLYAHWRPNVYTVVFEANGGNAALAAITCSYDVTYTLPTYVITRENHLFVGWSTNANDTVAMFKDGGLFANLTEEDGAEVTMYAVEWDCYLDAKYYDLTSSTSASSWYASVDAYSEFNSWFNARIPSLVTNTMSLGTTLDFGTTDSASLFHGKYGTVGTEYFALKLSGELYAEMDGTYQFSVLHDDCLVVYIDGVAVYSSSYKDGGIWYSTTTRLTAGWHTIDIGFLEYTSRQALRMKMQGPNDTALDFLPQSLLRGRR